MKHYGKKEKYAWILNPLVDINGNIMKKIGIANIFQFVSQS